LAIQNKPRYDEFNEKFPDLYKKLFGEKTPKELLMNQGQYKSDFQLRANTFRVPSFYPEMLILLGSTRDQDPIDYMPLLDGDRRAISLIMKNNATTAKKPILQSYSTQRAQETINVPQATINTLIIQCKYGMGSLPRIENLDNSRVGPVFDLISRYTKIGATPIQIKQAVMVLKDNRSSYFRSAIGDQYNPLVAHLSTSCFAQYRNVGQEIQWSDDFVRLAEQIWELNLPSKYMNFETLEEKKNFFENQLRRVQSTLSDPIFNIGSQSLRDYFSTSPKYGEPILSLVRGLLGLETFVVLQTRIPPNRLSQEVKKVFSPKGSRMHAQFIGEELILEGWEMFPTTIWKMDMEYFHLYNKTKRLQQGIAILKLTEDLKIISMKIVAPTGFFVAPFLFRLIEQISGSDFSEYVLDEWYFKLLHNSQAWESVDPIVTLDIRGLIAVSTERSPAVLYEGPWDNLYVDNSFPPKLIPAFDEENSCWGLRQEDGNKLLFRLGPFSPGWTLRILQQTRASRHTILESLIRSAVMRWGELKLYPAKVFSGQQHLMTMISNLQTEDSIKDLSKAWKTIPTGESDFEKTRLGLNNKLHSLLSLSRDLSGKGSNLILGLPFRKESEGYFILEQIWPINNLVLAVNDDSPPKAKLAKIEDYRSSDFKTGDIVEIRDRRYMVEKRGIKELVISNSGRDATVYRALKRTTPEWILDESEQSTSSKRPRW